MINDCSQRSFWPNGFAFFLYGQVQFDTSLTYEELLEDYFSHAYGEDWREVVTLLEKIGKAIDMNYLCGKRSADPKVHKRYNPAVAAELRGMEYIAEEYAAFLQAHRVMPMRAQTVAFKLMRYYMEYCTGLAKCLIPKCYGAGKEAKEMYLEFLKSFGRHEVEIETYFDQWMMSYAFDCKLFAQAEASVPTVEN